MANPRVRRTRRHQRHRERVMRAHDGVCHICGKNAADAIDHIVPVSWGGSDDPSNLAPAHTSCNTARGAARPPEWTYTRPSMWLPGYGPRAKGAMVGGSSSGVGCGMTALAVVAGVFAGGVVGAIGAPSLLVLAVACFVGVGIYVLARRGRTGGSPPVPGESLPIGRPEMKGEDGQVFIDARGEVSLGGMGADVPPEGDEMVTLPFEIEGDNANTLIDEVLTLRPGQSGYRDGISGPEGDDLVVYAMVRLAADVVATGDDDVGAAPVGRIKADAWRNYPGLGRGMTLVQVGLAVEPDGRRRGWIAFRMSAGVV